MAVVKCPKCGEEYDPMYSSHECKREEKGEKKKEEMGFEWGAFLMIAIFCIGIYNIFTLIKNIKSLGLVEILIYVLLIGFPLLVVLGLAMRKKWGLYCLYALLIISGLRIMISAIAFIIAALWTLPPISIHRIDWLGLTYGAIVGIIVTVVPLVILYLWFKYFQRRRHWFK